MKYIEAAKMLQSSSGKLNPIHALINFHSMVRQGYIPEGASSIQDLVEAKNTLLRSSVRDQVTRKGHFSIQIPFDNPCNKCKGTGELYKLLRFKEKSEPCQRCEGAGWFWKPCKCNGSGRYTRQDREHNDLHINTECRCLKYKDEWPKGRENLIKIKCRDCRAHMSKRKFVGLESTTKCPACKGFGFKHQYSQRVTNPAFPVANLCDIIERTEPEPQPEASDKIDLEAEAVPQEIVDKWADNSGIKLEKPKVEKYPWYNQKPNI